MINYEKWSALTSLKDYYEKECKEAYNYLRQTPDIPVKVAIEKLKTERKCQEILKLLVEEIQKIEEEIEEIWHK